MDRLHEPRVAGEQGFDEKRLVGLHHEVDPGPRDVDARQVAGVVDDLVDLRDDDAIAKRRRLDESRRVLGTGAGVQVACAVSLEPGNEHDVRCEVDIEPAVELDVGMDGPDLEKPVGEELRNAQALRAGKGEVELAGDASLEKVELLRTADARDDHVQIVNPGRVDLGEGARQEVRLLLVVAFEHDTVVRSNDRLEERDDVAGRDDTSLGDGRPALHAPCLFGAALIPLTGRGLGWHLLSSSACWRQR